ncbi:RHS repeat protein [Chitinophaga sp. Mgbs1]|uniref:RHS repeat protein n=1 Tax=Chitinophaga solisilvae TaxID=1233460 RepID=A0A9Q5CVC9_9BACT|nr:RHS repeat protein [Chitinophaga solisilvae]
MNSFAQADQKSDLPVFVPPSPNAAALGKYGDIPVGLYTGIPNISIPLHSINVGKFSMPLSLSYHSSGLKVEELASNVGLGWSMNAGGVITRTVQGKPDESSMGYWKYGNLDPRTQTSFNVLLFCNGIYDTQPDMFYFNFCGRSGKFVIDMTPEHKAHIIPFQDLLIEHDPTLKTFQVTDENGVKYIFDQSESTMVEPGGQSVYNYKSSWYLSKIITQSGTIELKYDPTEDLTTVEQASAVDYIRDAGNIGRCTPLERSSSTTVITTGGKVLTGITTPLENVRFFSSRNRRDITMASKLDSVVVSDYNGQVKKRYRLAYSYFGNNIDVFRLKLDTVAQLSVKNNSALPYILEYYTPDKVPAVKSYSQDYWGFYNGKYNANLLPEVDPRIWGTGFDASGADREPDPQEALSGMLGKIRYPTGGTSAFIYEGNDYGYNQSAPLNERAVLNLTAATSASAISKRNTRPFKIEYNQSVIAFTSGDYSGPASPEDGPSVYLSKINNDSSRTVIFSRVMIKSNAKTLLELDAGDYEITAAVDGPGQKCGITINYTAFRNVGDGKDSVKSLPACGLRIKRIINSDSVTNIHTVKEFIYKDLEDAMRSSGNRVSAYKFVEWKETHSRDCKFVQRTSYSTNYLGATQGSPIGYSQVTERITGTTNGTKTSYFTKSSNTDAQLYAIGPPNSEGLSNVRLNGRTAKAVTDMDIYRGYLSVEKYFDSNNKLVKEMATGYNFGSGPGNPNYYELNVKQPFSFYVCGKFCGNCDPTAPPGSLPCDGWTLNNYSFAESRIICPWVYKLWTMETTYGPAPADFIQKRDTFYYDNPQHGLPTRIVTTSSTGDTLLTLTRYPQDSIPELEPSAMAARYKLAQLHFSATPLKQASYRNNRLLRETYTNYKIWPSSLILPENVAAHDLNYPLEKRLVFSAYDTLGNTLQQSKHNDVQEVYLWGYKGQYPVARIVGSDYNTVVSKINTAILDNPSGDQVVRDEINKLRNAFKGTEVLVSTFTYSPLTGVTSETDPAGKVTYYEYDDFGRLSVIRDTNGKILKLISYNYQVPPAQ